MARPHPALCTGLSRKRAKRIDHLSGALCAPGDEEQRQ